MPSTGEGRAAHAAPNITTRPLKCASLTAGPRAYGAARVLTLRDVIESDLLVFFAHQQDPEANAMAAFPAREREAFFTHWRANVLGKPSATARTIVVDGEVVGNIGSWESDDGRYVGYWVGRSHWGKGIASAALAEFLASHEPARPLHAHVVRHNVGSIRVLEKCGFRPVGEPTGSHDGVAELLYCLAAEPPR